MSYSKNYYALRNPTEDKRILDYNNNMMKKQISHEKNELNKRLNRTKANVRFMGNGKGSIDKLIRQDMESDKPLGGRVMGSGKVDDCHCMMDKEHKKGKGKKATSIDEIMDMEEKEMKGKGFKKSVSIEKIKETEKKALGKGMAERMTKKGGMKSINMDFEGGMKGKGKAERMTKEGGAKKSNKWLDFVNKTRKETGKSLKDTLKYIKQNNLYKK